MKKLFYFAMALGLVACQAEKVDVNGGEKGEMETNYLSINLVTASGAKTRAVTENEDGTYTKDGADYEDGNENENAVSSVRFYFFDEAQNVASIKGEEKKYYYDWNNPYGNGTDHEDTVERILTAQIIINTKDGDGVPGYVVAVLNPTEDLKNADIENVESLTAYLEAFNPGAGKNSFVMSNSVFAANDKKVNAVSVAGHLYNTPEAAKADPVTIYVERVLAKASLTSSLEETETGNGIYKTSPNSKYKFGEKEIYVKFLGWNVTSTAAESRLMKEINPDWGLIFGGNEPWNWAGYRSFWAVNPDEMDYQYFNFGYDNEYEKTDDTNAAAALEVGKGEAYMQENAADDFETGAGASHPTQVIIAAQLVDETGNPMEFAEYAFEKYNVSDLLTKYADLSNIYILTDENEQKKYTKITAKDLKLATAHEAGQAVLAPAPEETGRYYSFAQLNPQEGTIYTIGNAENTSEANTEAINAELVKLGHAKVWTNGYTYYFFDIEHLGEEIGKYGVVRNHVYKGNVTALSGLGTPVYNPEEIIYPEKPGDEDTFIAAEIKILSWRIVSQDVQLNW